MKIDKLFLYFKSQNAFDSAIAQEAIKDDSIVFIEDKRAIWTHGHMFGTENSHAKGFFSSVEALPDGEIGDWAIVKNDGSWYIYYFDSSENRWVQGEIYNVTIPQEDLSDIYVQKKDILDFIKGYYDSVYVRKDEVYTPDVWDGTPGTDSPTQGGGSTGESTIHVDYELNNHSINPVANWVIHKALGTKISNGQLEQALDDYYTKDQVDAKLANIGATGQQQSDISSQLYNTLLNKFKSYYTKVQTEEFLDENYYNKEQVNNQFVRKENIDAYVLNLCNRVYVRQDSVYTPKGWEDMGGSGSDNHNDDPSNPVTPTPGGGGTYTVDIELSSDSSNPVANWVIKNALDNKVSTSSLRNYLEADNLSTAILSNESLMSSISNPIKDYVRGYAYTKAQVDGLLNNIQQLSIKVIDSTSSVSNPNSNTIYLIEQNGQYIEYVYDGQWREIGVYQTSVDFSDYYNKSEINERLELFVESADVYTKTYIDSRFENILDKFEDYYTKQQIDRDVVKNEDVYTISDGFDTIPGHDTPGSNSGMVVTGGPKHIILTESEYAQLSSYEVDAIYFVTEDVVENTTWTFGGTFPVTFTNGDTLDNIGTFPINLA